MAYYLPSNPDTDGGPPDDLIVTNAGHPNSMADLKVFWGPEICRLEYLLHLVNTGRIRDEFLLEAGSA
jgi:hypothetical protein